MEKEGLKRANYLRFFPGQHYFGCLISVSVSVKSLDFCLLNNISNIARYFHAVCIRDTTALVRRLTALALAPLFLCLLAAVH